MKKRRMPSYTVIKSCIGHRSLTHEYVRSEDSSIYQLLTFTRDITRRSMSSAKAFATSSDTSTPMLSPAILTKSERIQDIVSDQLWKCVRFCCGFWMKLLGCHWLRRRRCKKEKSRCGFKIGFHIRIQQCFIAGLIRNLQKSQWRKFWWHVANLGNYFSITWRKGRFLMRNWLTWPFSRVYHRIALRRNMSIFSPKLNWSC